LQVPEVHLTFRDVAKTSDHENMTKRTNLDGVSELLSEFKSRLTIQIVHRSHSRLLTCDHNKLLTILSPFNILDLIVENWNELSIFSFMDSNILE